MPRTTFLKTVAGMTLVILLAMWLASCNDDKTYDEESVIYCANVHDHTWPDYAGTYSTMCKDGLVKP